VTLLDTDALVVRIVEVGESDIVATLVTERVGKLAAVVAGARKGSRRVGGALEPVHTLAVRLDDRGRDLTRLKEARLIRMRPSLVADLDALEAAGVALRWARHLFPVRTPEPAGWRVLLQLLDGLDSDPTSPRRDLARAGLAMLAAVGYGLDLEACVACGQPCPEGRSACVDPARGGLVCRACGGGPTVLAPGTRAAARALMAGRMEAVIDRDALIILGVVDRAMAVHAGFDR
jgi:DNA repair protein RecO (recombination protein O)